jgi:acetyl-CoA acetyltransferase
LFRLRSRFRPRKHEEIGFTCSGSNDYLIGGPFSFVAALDSVGAWPPISESHVEMDGAWALYEAWIKLQTGHIDAALIYSFGKNSMTDIGELTALALDPYSLQPLWPDHISLAALQARAYLDASGKTERDLAEVAARSRRAARSNPHAILSGDATAEQLLQSDFAVAPLRTSDTPPITDGAAAIILAAGDFATRSGKKPAWITGLDHRIEAHQPGARDLTRSVSTGEGRRWYQARRRRRTPCRVQPRGADPAGGAFARRRRERESVRRAAGRQPVDGHRSHPNR